MPRRGGGLTEEEKRSGRVRCKVYGERGRRKLNKKLDVQRVNKTGKGKIGGRWQGKGREEAERKLGECGRDEYLLSISFYVLWNLHAFC